MKFFLSVTLFLSLIPTGSAQTLVTHSTVWRYRKGTSAPESDWKTTDDGQLNSTWLSGNGGFGFANNAAELSLCGTILNDMDRNYSTLAMRNSFEVTAPADPNAHLVLTMDWDDGFIAWLDGIFLVSANSPGSPNEPAFSAVATGSHESSRGDSSPSPAEAYDLGTVGTRLPPGKHVLSIVGLNSSKSNSSDFVQVAELSLRTIATNCLSGPIERDTHIEGTNSICGNVTVQPGAILSIAAGARLELDQGVSITVANGGRLLAEGNETNRIVFTKSTNALVWGNLVVEGSANSPETRITFADIEHNGTTAIHSSGGTLFLDHLNFLSTEHQYVSLDSSSFVVSNCRFPHGTTAFEPAHGTGGIKEGGHGIFARNFFGGAIGYSDIVDFTGGNRPSPIVHFINNVFMNGQDDGLDLDGTDGWVEGNLFLHFHRNGGTPDSSAAVSGGSDATRVSAVTVIGNYFFDCDNAATAKQGNFFSLLNNTILHITKTGGVDLGSGAINVRDTTPAPTSYARGFYLENNVIADVQELVRNYDAAQTTVTLSNNIIPMLWSGPGNSNVVAEPIFVHVPAIAETDFTNWADAQILREWLKLQTNSPGIGTGWEGTDQGGYDLPGARLSVALTATNGTSARIDVGYARSGSGIPESGWPEGVGYTHYKWRLDDGAWSESRPIENSIQLTNLAVGPHHLEVSGERDSGLFQDDPLFGSDATLSRTAIWLANGILEFTDVSRENGKTLLTVSVSAAGRYVVQFKDNLSESSWSDLEEITAVAGGVQKVFDLASAEYRFYRVVSKQ
jgi:hypothetical protein